MELVKRALIAMIDKKSIVGAILGALIALAAQLSGLSVSEVQSAACEKQAVEVPVEAPAK